VKVTPPLVVIPAGVLPAKGVQREVFVTVTKRFQGPAQSNVAVELPEGWKSDPPVFRSSSPMKTNRSPARFR